MLRQAPLESATVYLCLTRKYQAPNDSTIYIAPICFGLENYGEVYAHIENTFGHPY